MKKHLLIIDPATIQPEEQGCNEVIGSWEGTSTVLRPSLAGDGPRPGQFEHDVDAVVVLGSRASVHDDLPWLNDLSAWLQPIIDGQRDVPLLGICFGHQLIAHLGGGRVGFLREDHSKLVDYQDTTIDRSRIMPGEHRLRVLCSHREEVKELPQGYQIVGTRPESARDVMEHESRPIFSVQFHPEARDEFAVYVGLDAEGVDETLVNDSRQILSAFRELAAKKRGTNTS